MFADAFYSMIGAALAFAIICCFAFVYKWIKKALLKKWNNLREQKEKKSNNTASEEYLYNTIYNVNEKNERENI